MKRLTIILAHPKYAESIANKTIVEEVMSKYPDASLRNIYALYPEFNIDVKSEQKNLLDSDVVVFQYPMYWYNMPAIMKQYFDKVFEYGFAYGSNGDKLKDKVFLPCITIGSQEESYGPLGENHFRVSDFLTNLEQTAYFSQMIYKKPIVGYGMTYIPDVFGNPKVVKANAEFQAHRLLLELGKILK